MKPQTLMRRLALERFLSSAANHRLIDKEEVEVFKQRAVPSASAIETNDRMNRTPGRIVMRAGPLLTIVAACTLMFVPAASSQGGPPYTDGAADSGSAGDITGVTVSSDNASGQILFRISGSNLSTSSSMLTVLLIDSDANPATGDPQWLGADYVFIVDDTGYDFEHWNGSDWSPAPYSTVRVSGGGNSLLISVNRSELGNSSEFNFSGWTLNEDTKDSDYAPDDGMYNYSLAAGGPDIQGVALTTSPSSGPKAGKRFIVAPAGLKLPPNGAIVSPQPMPDSYTCRATINGRPVPGTATGGCMLRIAKKNTRGKALIVVVTVTYEGATKSVPFRFVVS